MAADPTLNDVSDFLNDKEVASSMNSFVRVVFEAKQKLAEHLYKKHGILSEGLRIELEGKAYLIMSITDQAPGYALAVEASPKERSPETTLVKTHGIYSPKSAAYAENALQDPGAALNEIMSDPEFLRLTQEANVAQEAAQAAMRNMK